MKSEDRNSPTTRPLVLILCTGNSCRSQMAEGILRMAAGAAVVLLRWRVNCAWLVLGRALAGLLKTAFP